MLIIFDWDGTLVDSAGKIVAAMHAGIAATGLAPRTDGEVREIIGLGLPEAIRALYPQEGEGAREALRQAYVEHYLVLDEVPCRLFPGAEAVLAGLAEHGHHLAVATGKSRRGLDRVLQRSGLARYFQATRCADETCSKPDPRMLHELLAHFRRPAAEAVMVGDSEYDMAMARSAGMDRIAVSYGVHERERLLRYEPLLEVDSLHELLHWGRARR